MELNRKTDGTVMTVALSGRLDTTTAPALAELVRDGLDGITRLVLELDGLDYISSVGLRVLLEAQKKMGARDGMVLRGVGPEVSEIFEITGFNDILSIE